MLDALLASPPPVIRSLGRSIFDPVWREKQHAGRHIEILHVLQGEVVQEMRDFTVRARGGDTIITPTAMPHRDVFPPGSTFEVYLAHFDWDGEPALWQQFSPAELADVSPPVRAQVAADFHRLYADFQHPGPLGEKLAQLRLHQILLTLCRDAAAPDDEPTHRAAQIMQRARQIIHDRYAEPLTLDAIAEAVGVSAYHLSHVFSAESGFTLSSYLTSVRMDAAAAMLLPGAKIADIAEAVGFRDPQYFSRVFRAHFGVAPSRYR